MSSLPNPRLIITTHKPDGTSIIARDTTTEPRQPFGPNTTAFSTFHMTPSLPADPLAALDPTSTSAIPRPQPGGAFFGATDIMPGGRAPMHRTLTIDYAVVIAGSIWLVLDGGEETEIKAGEFLLQRGTNHSWVNKGEVPCRIVFVMIGSEAITLADGTVLEETKLPAPPRK